jgi:hypothetical protein
MIIGLQDVSYSTPKGCQRLEIYVICRHGATRRLREGGGIGQRCARQAEAESGSEDRQHESAEEESRGHDPAEVAERESAGPIEGGSVNRMPADGKEKVEFEDGEEGNNRCEKNRADHADARGAFDHRVRYTARSAISPGKA